MVKPRKLLLGAIFVGGLLVSNAASAITKEEALAPALAWAGVICATHPEYQSKSGKCDVKVFLYDPSTGEYDTYITTVKKFDRDGLLDGKRWWYGDVIKNGKKVHFGLGMSKHLDLCEKDGWWYKQTGAVTYKAILCRNGKPVVSYEVYTQDYDNDGPIFYLDSPSGGGDAAPSSLYNVAILDQYYCSKLLSIGEALPYNKVEEKAIKCTGWSLSHFSCVNNGALAACYPYWDESLSGVAARAIGLR